MSDTPARWRLAEVSCPWLFWTLGLIGGTLIVDLAFGQRFILLAAIAGTACAAVGLEISQRRGGDCDALPESLATRVLVYLLTFILNIIVVLPGLARRDGIEPVFRIIPAVALVSVTAFFAIHLREHESDAVWSPAWLVVLARLPFYLLALIATLLFVGGIITVIDVSSHAHVR